ncbi:MAG TPA: iron-siderophore ABC transporter substrate-binding protein [Leptolyngbyaceae cyanobacterium M33_DOE_097]|uniref:Iron-siderophore ABC transporter substrate-binding protein n=1 Tax=Oscillatoriales cyanobacterium SpSt-418 TaxID=2282169 RepID=A0A7C3PDX1_9CYAN|nr:iron-siderophore ABC transporter substrate-binding protein [Leptolyngbyaceae cyanobacterium M33_DOE_097]
MIRKVWWRRVQLFLVGALVIVLLQSCHALPWQPSQTSSKEATSTCRNVRHALGESCIPQHPQRIITMDQDSLEMLVALGLNPIATTTANRVGNKLPILQDKISTIVDLGKEGQPNFEKIVQLKPDLIVGLFVNPQVYSLLSKVAPTISVEYSHTDWKKTLHQVAEIFGQPSKADELLSAYQQRLEVVRSQLAQKFGTLKITAMRFYTDAHLTQFLNQNSFTISVLDELKTISIPEIQQQQRQVPNSDWGYVNISVECIDWLEADAMFLALDPGAESSLEKFSSNPLWQTLNVVQRNQVYIVDSSYWIFGNILSANAILDDLLKHLSDENSK